MLTILTILASFLLPVTLGSFQVPMDQAGALPYGRQLRGVLSRSIPLTESTPDENLQWWYAIDRNNTIDCKCGEYTESKNMTDRWKDEGVEKLNVYPWSVSLVAPGQAYSYCGGSLINDRYVLTSATCVDGSMAADIEVLIGTWPKAHFMAPAMTDPEMSDPDELNHQTLIRKKVHRVILHPSFDSIHLDNNIALLRLLGPVPGYGTDVTPVCLPSESDVFDGQNSSSLLWRFHTADDIVVPVKRSEVNSTILSKEECKSHKVNREWENMPDTMLCAQFDPPGENHPYVDTFDCPGDGGSFLLADAGSRKVQVGVDSWTACYGNKPKGVGIFTRITEFMSWIRLHIADDGRNCGVY